MKTGKRLIEHARYPRLFLAEGYLTLRFYSAAWGGWRRCRRVGERLEQPKKANIRQREAGGVERCPRNLVSLISLRTASAGQDCQPMSRD